MKANIMRSLSLLVIILLFFSCTKEPYQVYTGEAQGTTFSIKFMSPFQKSYEAEIDSIFTSMDDLFSTYKEGTFINKFNKSERGIPLNPDFKELWEFCWELSIESNGYFDPTLAPVFDFYREFNGKDLDTALLMQTLSHTGMPLISISNDSLIKRDAEASINLNAIAQGYTVDVIANFLFKKGIVDMMVEVGGEVYAIGKNDKSKTWTIGIDKPKIDGSRELMASIKLDGKAMATSGNYRKFTVMNGKRMGHILNPKTALPSFSNVLSISVLNKDCYRADALATALMNMTSSEIKDYDANNDGIEIVLIELIESDTVLYSSPGLEIELFD